MLSDAAHFTLILSEIFSLIYSLEAEKAHVLPFWTHTSGHSLNQVTPPPPPRGGEAISNTNCVCRVKVRKQLLSFYSYCVQGISPIPTMDGLQDFSGVEYYPYPEMREQN